MVELTCWTVIHTLGIWCLLYWHLTLQLLWSQSSKLKSLLWTLPENSTGSLSPLHQSLRDKFLSHQYQKVSPFQANKEVSPSIPHCLSGGKWSVYTDRENTRLHNDEKLKWHSWSANWRSQQGIHSLFSSNRKILHLFQPQSQIKYELMNSQQLTPQIQIYMLKISKSTNASTQKVPLVFCSRYLSEKKNICARNRFTEQEGQNFANKCQMSIDDFFI